MLRAEAAKKEETLKTRSGRRSAQRTIFIGLPRSGIAVTYIVPMPCIPSFHARQPVACMW